MQYIFRGWVGELVASYLGDEGVVGIGGSFVITLRSLFHGQLVVVKHINLIVGNLWFVLAAFQVYKPYFSYSSLLLDPL